MPASADRSGGPARPDHIASFFNEPTARRLLVATLFVGTLWALQDLLVFFLSFVAFSLLLKSGTTRLRKIIPAINPRLAFLCIVSLASLFLSLIVWYGGASIIAQLETGLARLPILWQHILQSDLFVRFNSHLPDANQVSAWLSKHLGRGLGYAAALGRSLALCLIGAVVAVVYVSEEEELVLFRRSLEPHTFLAQLASWWGYFFDGVAVMLRTQLAVALINAILTWPILALLNLPQVPTLTVLVFISGFVPVLGNVVMGILLSLIAYSTGGLGTMLLLLVLTVVLHKLESYFVNPRLATKYINAPTFVIIVSLLVSEQILGLSGIFLSVPFLYLWQQIRRDWQAGPSLS